MTDEIYRELFMECLFNDLDEDITSPNFRLNIGGVDCVSSGSIVAVAGKSGVGKSTTIAIMAGVLMGNGEFGNIKCLKRANNILWVDTEKDPFSCRQRTVTLRNVAGMDDKKTLVQQGVQFLRLKNISVEDRISMLEKVALKNMEKNIYDAVFIDGIFDLTDDPGNLQKVTRIMQLLKNMSESGSTVFGMLHTNKQADDDNMREVLGTEFQRLCTNRFLVKYDNKKKCHNIIHDKSNDTKLSPTVSFQIDETGVVVPFGLPTTDRNQTINENFKKDFETILAGGLILSYKELVEEVAKTANVKSDMAKKRIKTGYNDGYLLRDNDGKYYLKNDNGVMV